MFFTNYVTHFGGHAPCEYQSNQMRELQLIMTVKRVGFHEWGTFILSFLESRKEILKSLQVTSWSACICEIVHKIMIKFVGNQSTNWPCIVA